MSDYYSAPSNSAPGAWSGDTMREPTVSGGIPYPDLRCICLHDGEPEGERECLMCGHLYNTETK